MKTDMGDRDILLVDFLEDIFEATVVAFEDGVLGGHV